MWNLKNTTNSQRKRAHRYREELVVTSGESERGWSKIGAEDEQAQTVTYKISHKGILYNREYSQYSVTTANGV